MKGYSIEELKEWTARIEEKARSRGLDCYPQEFEICDHNQMLGFMAYSGLPSHYPHWSYGKAFERLKTIYDHGVTGLPYEMVINSNPCLAYLMRDNTLLLQILTIAHVFGHNDFFKNNFTFRNTRPELAVDTFKLHADRVRDYVEDPSLGIDRVERILNAAHSLALQCRQNLTTPRLTEDERKRRFDERESRRRRETMRRGERFDEAEYLKALRRTPVEPDEDLLLFIRDHNRHLEDWERDLLTIVDEQTRYFIPQIETKIMNEGWASYWHKVLLESLDLPEELHLEFLVRHSQVVAPHKGRVNPYHVGYTLWNSIRIWYDGMLDATRLRADERELFEKMRKDYEERDAHPEGSGSVSGAEALFRIREADRDTSFLRRFLTLPLMQELDLFEYRPQPREQEGRLWVVSRVPGPEDWREVRETLIRSVGMNAFPVIRVEDSNYRGNSTLLLRHSHDGRDLDLESAEKTLQHLRELWGSPVVLLTVVNGAETRLELDESGRFVVRGAA